VTGAPVLGGVRITLYAQPPQPVMRRLRVGERFYGKLVGTATTSASGAYTIRVTYPEAITSSEYYGNVNLMVEAAEPGWSTFYGVPRKVVDNGTKLVSTVSDTSGAPAKATLALHRVSKSDASVGVVPATDDCWVLTTDDGPVLDRIDGVWGEMDGVRKYLSYTAGSTSTVGIAEDADGSGWVSGNNGTTTVVSGSMTQPFPEKPDYTSVIWRSEFEEGTFDSCEISADIASFPYGWNGGAYAETNSPPSATHCVYEPATSDPQVGSTAAMTWSDGISLGSPINVSLSSVTGYTSTTAVTYSYTVNGYFCGTRNYPGRSDPGPTDLVANSTVHGN
jgi:hypothetical protein